MKWYKLILIHLTITFEVNIINTRLLATTRIITHYLNHILLYKFTTWVYSKLVSFHRLSNYAVHGLEPSETDLKF